jgi:hypothetical protein
MVVKFSTMGIEKSVVLWIEKVGCKRREVTVGRCPYDGSLEGLQGPMMAGSRET